MTDAYSGSDNRELITLPALDQRLVNTSYSDMLEVYVHGNFSNPSNCPQTTGETREGGVVPLQTQSSALGRAAATTESIEDKTGTTSSLKDGELNSITNLVQPPLKVQQISQRHSMRDNKADLGPPRSISGTKSITTYFSPSPSSKPLPVVSQPVVFPLTNLSQQLPTTEMVREDCSKRLLPALSDEAPQERPDKRMKFSDISTIQSDSLHNQVEEVQSVLPESVGLAQPAPLPTAFELYEPDLMIIDEISTTESSEPVSQVNMADMISVPLTTEGRDTAAASEYSESNISVSVDDRRSPETFAVGGNDIRDELDTDHKMDLDDDVHSSDSESFEEYDPYFDTFEVRFLMTLLIIDNETKTCTPECRRQWLDYHPNPSNSLYEDFHSYTTLSTIPNHDR